MDWAEQYAKEREEATAKASDIFNKIQDLGDEAAIAFLSNTLYAEFLRQYEPFIKELAARQARHTIKTALNITRRSGDSNYNEAAMVRAIAANLKAPKLQADI